MLRQRSMSVVTDPIREGQLPQKLTFSLEEVGVTCSSYAAYVEYTNDFVERNPIDGLQRLTKGLADSAALSLLVITRETLYLAASKAYTGDAASLDGLTTGLTLAGLQAITNQM
ncbi:hypothetical protein Zmor_022112 [Zophobas morio]|uniref:Uncharacterized protein n=1 Tax=Zophobas morio TaxID=2755281 RepID=A0AA38M0K0_9CUCU|nr:hypothetical protein Zmor_022112 [Zophobas morio]